MPLRWEHGQNAGRRKDQVQENAETSKRYRERRRFDRALDLLNSDGRLDAQQCKTYSFGDIAGDQMLRGMEDKRQETC